MSRHHSKTHTEVPTLEQDNAPHLSAAAAPTHDEIAHRAYDIYVKTGCKQGHCKQNWNQAEQSLRDQGHAGHRA